MRTNRNNLIGFVIILFVCGMVFMVYDRCTGTTKLTMGIVTDKWHEHEEHTETDDDGNTSTHTHDYYWVNYRREDGVKDRYDVGYWSFSDFREGQRIVVKGTVGGVSGLEYCCGISVFTGAEQ